MDVTTIVGDVLPAPPQLVMPYNITLNLTSILAFFPARLLSKLWKSWDGVVELGMASEEHSVGDLLAETVWTTTDGILEAAAQETVSPRDHTPLVPVYPGPWTFFISGYMLGIFVVALVLHRIQNIIIPSQIPGRGLRPGVAIGWQRRFAFFGQLSSAIFPLDLSRASTRIALHFPTLYFLAKMLTVWIVLVLQTSELYPKKGGVAWVDALGNMVLQSDMKDICWNTFIAVCAAFSVEGFVKALDGVEAGFPIGGNMNPNTSPFNIFGYAFLLHLYSSPFAHSSNKGDGLPSRPDKHAVITVAIPLLQLTIFHTLSMSKRWSTHRLFPTALSSFLSLLHFHSALLAYYRRLGEEKLLDGVTRHSTLITTYPILNYVPNIFETALILTILLTISLNVLVQMIVRGRVDRLFSGLGVSRPIPEGEGQVDTGLGIHALFQNLPYDEDFGVLLLRVGIASLEATGLRGWSNEVAPIPAFVRHRRAKSRNPRVALGHGPGLEYGSVRMGRIAAGGVQAGYRASIPASSSATGAGSGCTNSIQRRRTQAKGLRNEVRTVDIGVGLGSQERGGGLSRNNPMGRWWRWLKEVLRFGEAIWAAFKGLMWMLRTWILPFASSKRDREKDMARRRRTARNRHMLDESDVDFVPMSPKAEQLGDYDSTEESSGSERDRLVYERFLRGENVSDDEDDDGEFILEDDDGECEDGFASDGSDTRSDDLSEEPEDREREAFGLFTDLIRSGEEGKNTCGDVVLAHLMTNTSPMTRRRWEQSTVGLENTSTSSGFTDHDGVELENDGRDAHGDFGMVEDLGRVMCVVCTSSVREIICWPCRCLALCDGCRESMASRSAPTKHRCPCCRQLIEGYSRIYIP